VDIIDTATRAVTGNIPVGNEPVGIFINQVPFGWVTNRLDNDVTIIRPNVFDAIGDVPAGVRTQGVAGTLDSEVVVFTNRTSNTLTVHGARTGVQRNVATGAGPIAVDVVQYESLPNQTVNRINDLGSASALAYVANASENTVTVVDITTDPATPGDFTAAAILTIAVGNSPVDVAFQPNGAIALVANRDDDTVSIIEVSSHTVIDTVNVGSAPEGIAFSPDGKRAYVANANGTTVTVLE
jgi:YVTN family beta-propeller protein